MKQKLISKAIINSIGVLIYTSIVATIMNNGEKLFGKTDTVFTAMAVLMLFVLSASVVCSLTIVKPVTLYIDGQKKEAFQLLTATIATLFVLTVIVLGVNILI